MSFSAFVSVLLLILLALPGCTGKRPLNNGTNVLLVILDTVRADRFSCYGHDRPTTPKMDLIATRGVRFENFYSNSSWTLAAHASLFTGMYAAGHRATQETLKLSPEPTTLAEVLGEAGYETFGASANGVVSVNSGLGRGFDTFVEVFRREFREQVRNERGHLNNIAFKRFLESSDREKPFFAFLNYIAAHAPYTPVEPHRTRLLDPGIPPERVSQATRLRMPDHYMRGKITQGDFAVLSQLYDGEINFLDTYVFDLLNLLKLDNRLGNTLIIITSDHGENIGDHGHFAHVFSIYNTLLKIPLIVVLPDGSHAGEVRHDTAQLLDLFPTIIEQCGIEHRGPPEGRDLFAKDASAVEATVMAEYYYPRQVLSVFDEDELVANAEKFIPFMRRLRAIQNGRMKLIWGSDGLRELYDVVKDSGEVADLLDRGDHPAKDELLEQLEYLVANHHGDTPLDPPPPVGWMIPGFEGDIDDPELLEKLRSLGYIK
jgi:arylsulfatase A-like enzyme